MPLLSNNEKKLRISDTIEILTKIKAEHGDLPVWWTNGEWLEYNMTPETIRIRPHYDEYFPKSVHIGPYG